MVKVILDTNTFYSYYQVSHDEPTNTRIHIPEFLDYLSTHQDDLYISSVSFYEILIHTKKQIGRMREYLRFMEEKNIRILYWQYFPITLEMQKLDSLCDTSIIKCIENDILPMRIEIESRFLSFYILKISLIYFVNHLGDPDNHVDSNKIIGIEKSLSDSIPKLISEIKRQLKAGYLEDDQEKISKEVFYRQLCNYVVFINMVLNLGPEETIIGIKEEENASIVDMEKLYEFFFKEVKRYKISSNNDVEAIIREISQQKGLSQYQIKFMDWIIQKIGDRKGLSFKKNDIDDMLIANVLNDPDNLLITWDDNFISFLKEYHHSSYEIISNVYKVKNTN